MPNDLILVKSKAELSESIHQFNVAAPKFPERARKLLCSTTYWVYDADEEMFGPAKFVAFSHMNFPLYEQAIAGAAEGERFHGSTTKNAVEALFDSWIRFEPDCSRSEALTSWAEALLGPGILDGVDKSRWQFIEFRQNRNYWAFLANPNKYRIADAVRDLKEDSWLVHKSEVKTGDRVAICKAKGRDKHRGVVALAEVLSDPTVWAGGPGDGAPRSRS